MQLWDNILQMALLGSERTHLEPAVEESLRRLKIDPEDPLPQVILTGAATLHQLRKIQMPVTAFDSQMPEPATDEEGHQALPPSSLLHLKQILSGRYSRALPEFVRLLTLEKRLLPSEFLPELLDDCLKDQNLWQAVQPLLGSRAKWLIALRPEWQWLIPKGDPERWAVASQDERKQIVSFLRNNSPEAALPLLEAAWHQLSYKRKLGFLELLKVGLSAEDEPFLEARRQDSRKEVRAKVADLLAGIPESRLVRSLFKHLLPCFSYTAAGQRLDVKLPGAIPEEILALGLPMTVSKGRAGGLKVGWLSAGVARIPARYWMEKFDWTPEEMVAVFGSCNRADLLLAALGESALRYHDDSLAKELIRYLIFKTGQVPEGLAWQSLARQIPDSAFQEMVQKYFQQHPGLLEEKHLLTGILELGVHSWNEAMALHIVGGLKQWMIESKTFFWNLWHYKRLLEIAAYCSPVQLFDNFNADWPVQSPVWNQWAPDVERMLRIMRFRKEMLKL